MSTRTCVIIIIFFLIFLQAFSVFAKIFEGLNIPTKPTMEDVNTTRYDFCAYTYDEVRYKENMENCEADNQKVGLGA